MILLVVVLASLCTTISCKKEGYVLSPSSETSPGISVCPGAPVPIGTIVPFYQAGKKGTIDTSAIPFGWRICDGKADPDTGVVTPNLSGKYLMGASTSADLTAVNSTYTYETTLTDDQVPLRAHDHSISFLASDGRDSNSTGYKTAVVANNSSLGLSTDTTGMAATEPLNIPVSEYIPNFPIVYIMYVGTKKKDSACADMVT
tara:strand:+ start:853 stop:1458 length:606 start_codon:yes stop_codon:yes gene_type:complete